jgi:peptide subunit release factor 1 (eRF1)
MTIIAFSVNYLPPSLYKALSIGTVTVFTVGVVFVYVGITCPKCNKILGLKFVYAEETLRRCPRCGIDFDEDSL